MREIKICNLIQAPQIKWTVIFNDIVRFDLKLFHEFVKNMSVDDLVDFKTNWWTKATTCEFLLHSLEDVICLIFVEVEILVTGNAEEEVIFERDAREEI